MAVVRGPSWLMGTEQSTVSAVFFFCNVRYGSKKEDKKISQKVNFVVAEILVIFI